MLHLKYRVGSNPYRVGSTLHVVLHGRIFDTDFLSMFHQPTLNTTSLAAMVDNSSRFLTQHCIFNSRNSVAGFWIAFRNLKHVASAECCFKSRLCAPVHACMPHVQRSLQNKVAFKIGVTKSACFQTKMCLSTMEHSNSKFIKFVMLDKKCISQ